MSFGVMDTKMECHLAEDLHLIQIPDGKEVPCRGQGRE